jgi:hypothetical protein
MIACVTFPFALPSVELKETKKEIKHMYGLAKKTTDQFSKDIFPSEAWEVISNDRKSNDLVRNELLDKYVLNKSIADYSDTGVKVDVPVTQQAVDSRMGKRLKYSHRS